MVVRRIKNDELMHHGVKGQRWGVRRYQNANGTLTPEGKAKLEKLRGKASDEITKRMLQQDRNYIKKMSKLSSNIKKASESGNDKKVTKLQNEVSKTKTTYDKGRAVLNREMKTIKDYSLSDFKKEGNMKKKAVAEAYCRSALLSLASIGLTVYTGGTVPAFTVISIPNMRAHTTKYRMQVADKKEKYGANISDKAARLYESGDMEGYKRQLEKDKRRYGE